MDNETFNRLVENRITKIRTTLVKKAAEYASDVDRLHNFKVAALIGSKPCSPAMALLGIWRKHIVSVLDIIDKADRGIYPSEELLDEKITDTINYAILLEAIIVDRQVVVEGTNAVMTYKI